MRSLARQLKTSVSVSVVFQNYEMIINIEIDLVNKIHGKMTTLVILMFDIVTRK